MGSSLAAGRFWECVMPDRKMAPDGSHTHPTTAGSPCTKKAAVSGREENMTKRKKSELQMKQQLGITTHRGETFVGLRPTVFADRRERSSTREARKYIRTFDC